MIRIRQTSIARDDLIAIWRHIAVHNLAAADKLWNRFEQIFEALAAHPGMGRHYGNRVDDMRCYPVGRYIIFYVPDATEILIYRVMHSARNIEELLDGTKPEHP